MTAKEKCIKKWEKKLSDRNRKISHPIWGKYLTEEKAQIPIIEEAIKDLKRFLTHINQ